MSPPGFPAQPGPSSYPGERLKLPQTGPGSVARVGRRLAALVLDWWIATIVVFLIWGPLPAVDTVSDQVLVAAMQRQSLSVLGVFVILQVLSMVTIGGSIGHRILGMYVAPLRGGWVGLWRPLVRSVLLALVIPALVWDSDQRGFHDKIAGTVLLRTH